MRALLLLPCCLLATSCALTKKDKTEASKPGYTIYEAPKEWRETNANAIAAQGNKAPSDRSGNAAADLPGGSGPAPFKPVPNGDTTGYRMPDPVGNKVPDENDFRGSSNAAQKPGNNAGVIAKPPKE